MNKHPPQNRLDSSGLWARLRRKAPRVTAIIGFVAKDAIVLASDSQMTMTDSTKIPTRKIHKVVFADGYRAIFAMAGMDSGANLFLENFTELATRTYVTDYRSVANTAETALKNARAKILQCFRDDALTSDQNLTHLQDFDCEVLLAYGHEGKPYLFEMSLRNAIAIKLNRDYTALGSAANVANTLLPELDLKELKPMWAIGVAFYVIEICKRVDLHCSGQTQVGFLSYTSPNDDPFMGGPAAFIERVQDAVERVRKKMNAALSDEIIGQFAQSLPSEFIAKFYPTAPPPPSVPPLAVEPATLPAPVPGRPSTPPAAPMPPPPDSSPA